MTDKTDHMVSPRLRLTLRQLEVFVATVRGGSTRAAADRIARSQSATSTALAELEAALGTDLFDRVGRRLVLNENGRALLPMAASFTIGDYLLPRMIADWTGLHPKSQVRLRIGNTSEVIEAVAGFDVDVGFIEGPQTHPDLVVRPWLDDELVIVAAPDHPLAGRPVSHRQLAQATWVLREHGSGTRQVTDAWLINHLDQVRVGFELGSTEAIKGVVAAGAGLGCVSRHAVAQSLADGRLAQLRTRLPRAVRRLATVQHTQKRLGRVTREFLAHCQAAAPQPRRARAR